MPFWRSVPLGSDGAEIPDEGGCVKWWGTLTRMCSASLCPDIRPGAAVQTGILVPHRGTRLRGICGVVPTRISYVTTCRFYGGFTGNYAHCLDKVYEPWRFLLNAVPRKGKSSSTAILHCLYKFRDGPCDFLKCFSPHRYHPD